MNIELKKPYNIFLYRDIEEGRIICIENDGQYHEIYVGLTYRSAINEHQMNNWGGIIPLHSATIVVSVDFLGRICLLKNRLGNVIGITDATEVREVIMANLGMVGLNEYQRLFVMSYFNRAITEITDMPIITNRQYPLGITYRDYRLSNQLVMDYRIKKHELI